MTLSQYLLTRIGCGYESQATGPDTFSCSGLVSWGGRAFGLVQGHLTEEEWLRVFFPCRLPPTVPIQPDDILLFGDPNPTAGERNPLKHMAVAVSGWQMIHSTNGGPSPGVQLAPINSRKDLAHVLRIPH